MTNIVETAAMTEQGYSGKAAAEIVGITYRQLDYWARTDLIRPSISDAKGSGSRRLYSYRDLIELKIIKKFLDGGKALESIREMFGVLRDKLGEDIASANIVFTAAGPFLVHSNEEIVDLLAQPGQGFLQVLPLDALTNELAEAEVVELGNSRGGSSTRQSLRTQVAKA